LKKGKWHKISRRGGRKGNEGVNKQDLGKIVGKEMMEDVR
jgi:hypothetical protein